MAIATRQAAWPSDHGSWVFLLLPLLVGLVLGGRPTVASGWLAVGALGGFLARQPLTLAARVAGGRRRREDLPVALRWIAIWGALGAIGALGLVAAGRARLFWLVLPALPVLAIQLQLVARRAERRRPALEIAGAGLLALAGPAAYWCGAGTGDLTDDLQGWGLWSVLLLQAVASILHVHALLVRRGGADSRSSDRLAWIVGLLAPPTAFLLVGVPAVALVPQAIENVLGRRRPLAGVRPTAVGMRQLALSLVSALLLIAAWLVRV